MCIPPGGWTIKNSISPGDIILNMAADSVCRLYGFNWGIENLNGTYKIKGKQKEAGGYGASLKKITVIFLARMWVWLVAEKPLPEKKVYCEIDPSVVDKYGIPVLRFNTSYTDYEIKQAKHMKETFAEILHSYGRSYNLGR